MVFRVRFDFEEESTKEQILAWLQFIAGKRSRDDKSDVFLVCTFCENDREDVDNAKEKLRWFVESLKTVIENRFPSV